MRLLALGQAMLVAFAASLLWNWHIEATAGEFTWDRTLAASNASMVELYRPAYNGRTVGPGIGSADSLLAFPSCEGPGCGALQQYRPHGVRVCRVTTLASSGTGSLRACMEIVEADSNTINKPLDYVVFDTGGAILWSPTCASSGCSLWRGVFVNGLSAPSPVLLYRWAFTPRKESQDVVVRGLAIRGKSGTSGGMIQGGGRRMVYDHNSISAGNSRMFSVGGDTSNNARDTTLFAGRFYSHTANFFGYTRGSTGPTTHMFSTWPRVPADLTHGVLSARNLYVTMHGQYRLPNISIDSIWNHNNVYWGINWGAGPAASLNNEFIASWTYNIMRTNNTNKADDSYYLFGPDSLGACRNYDTQNIDNGIWCLPENKKLYSNKNSRVDYAIDSMLSQDSMWRGSRRYIGTYLYTDSTSPPLEYRQTTPIPYNSPFGYDTIQMSDANADLIADSAGSGLKIDSLGQPYMVYDSFDVRFRLARTNLTQYRRAIDTLGAVKWFPDDPDSTQMVIDWYTVDQGKPKCRDEELFGQGDGMCDAWEELAYGDTSLVATEIQASGYAAIELAYMGGITNIDTTFGYDPPPPAAARTYGDGRYAFKAPLDSIFITIGTGADTQSLWRYIPDRDSVPVGYEYFPMLNAPAGSMIVLTYDSIEEIQAGWLDSADVDAIASDLGFSYPPEPWSIPLPGQP